MGISGLTVTGAFPAPSPVGAYNLTVVVKDLYGAQQTVNANWYVFPRLRLAASSAKCVQSSAQCVVQVGYSGGTPNVTPKVTLSPFNPASGPPRGYTVSASGGVLNFQANGQGWIGSVTITLTDQSQCGPGSTLCSASLSVSINL